MHTDPFSEGSRVTILKAIAAAPLLLALPASAQPYNPSIALQARPPAPIMLPNPLQTMQQIQSIEASRARTERDRAEARLFEEQKAAMEAQRRNEDFYSSMEARISALKEDKKKDESYIQKNQTGISNPLSDTRLDKWLISAQPRMHLYKDFDKVVFAPDVPISESMIDLMSDSQYAADIAYYLATHKIESLAISKMNSFSAAKALAVIEQRFMPQKSTIPVRKK